MEYLSTGHDCFSPSLMKGFSGIKIQMLAEYYGNTATSVFQSNTIAANKLFRVDRETFSQRADFWKDFSSS